MKDSIQMVKLFICIMMITIASFEVFGFSYLYIEAYSNAQKTFALCVIIMSIAIIIKAAFNILKILKSNKTTKDHEEY